MHRAMEFERGFLCDLICHAEEAVFRSARDAAKNTNGKDNITETIVRKCLETEKWQEEHGRVRYYQSKKTWTKMIWDHRPVKFKQSNVIIPSRWAYGAANPKDREDFESFLKLIAHHDLRVWGERPKSGQYKDALILKTGFSEVSSPFVIRG